ncbi:phosphotransferase [Salinimicrobium sp. TH3]|uniref:phosphotransferase n=1 Tax=Salinimicrobium sp. TH3 TaxID=2997342 RepID=UPI002275EBF1|nr:phosphotransferase [Salinimicrobium sp. TH3]MCY2687794.1 phosphotransferase [Salinimicrobium sp. TH3]
MKGVLKKGGDNLFYSFSNDDGKRWIMPKRRMSTAMNLYQPSHWKGKLAKSLFPYVNQINFVRNVIGAEMHNYELEDEIKHLLCNLFKKKNIEFSVFCGTPSVFQKSTIQISLGNEILGYCKVTRNEEIKKIFFHENQVLEFLNRRGISSIPECLYSGALNKNTEVFIQNTIKTNSSKITNKWSDLHTTFLNDLHQKTQVKIPFEETDFAHSLNVLEGFLASMPTVDSDLIKKALLAVRNFFGEGTVEFSVFHADFTPWNMFVEKDELFVFDFEYAKFTFPPYLDFFHFITQIEIIEKKSSHVNIYNSCEIFSHRIPYLKQNFSIQYLSYLLAVVAFYFKINKKALGKDDKCYKRWLPLIRLIVNKKL